MDPIANMFRVTALLRLCGFGSRVAWMDSKPPPLLLAGIMGLPRELRNMIWTEKILSFSILNDVIITSPEGALKLRVPAFCYTKRQILAESLPIFLRQQCIVLPRITEMEALKHVLARVPIEHAYRNVRWLIFHDVKEVGPNMEKLFGVCTEVRHVELYLHGSNFRSGYYSEGHRRLWREEVQRTFDLGLLKHCKALKELTLHCADEATFGSSGAQSEEATAKVFEHLVDFAKATVDEIPGAQLVVEYSTWWD